MKISNTGKQIQSKSSSYAGRQSSTKVGSAKSMNNHIVGKIDDCGRVCLPIVLFACDGFELELEAMVNLQFGGALLIPETIADSIGWRCLGARRVRFGAETKIISQYLGLVAFAGQTQNIVILGGFNDTIMLGQKLLSQKRLEVDFKKGCVLLDVG